MNITQTIIRKIKRDGFGVTVLAIAVYPLRRFGIKISTPLKLISPFLYTNVIRRLSGHNASLDKMVGLNLTRLNELSAMKQRKLFVDCGVNEGFVLKRYVGKLSDFDFVGFEIQEELIPIAQRANPTVEIINKAISNVNGELTMYLPRSYGQNFRGGTSTEPNKVKKANLYEERKIQALRFVEFLKSKIESDGYDFVAVKMDIEGTEYKIIDDLYESFKKDGKRLVDCLMVEYHPEVLAEESNQSLYDAKLVEIGVEVSHWV